MNIKIIRETDGYVSKIDCLNILQMMKQNKLMLIYNMAEHTENSMRKDITETLEKSTDDIIANSKKNT